MPSGDREAYADLFWQADRAEREFRPHAAATYRATFLENCDRATTSSESVAFLCALARREAQDRRFVRHLPFADWINPTPDLPWPLLQTLPFAERTALSARGFLAEPLRGARTGAKGYVALESAVRLFSQSAEPAWWNYLAAVSQRHSERVASAALQLAQQGVSLADAIHEAQARRDGVDFGWAPQLGYRSFFGLFAGVQVWDDRLGDLPRGLRAGVVAFSTLGVSATAEYWDRHSLSPLIVETNAGVGWERHRYFLSSREQPSDFRQTNGRGKVALGYELVPALTLRLAYGAQWRGAEGFDGGLALGADRGMTLHGPEVSLTWDQRDSAVVARQGSLFQVGTRQWSSNRDSTQTEAWARGDVYVPLSRRLSWNATATAALAAGNRSRQLLPLWGTGTLALPGVAQERYRARQGVGASSELQSEIAEGVRGVGFLSAIALSDPMLARDSFLAGGGLGAEIAFARRTRPTLRIELGWLSGEWNFEANWRVAL